MGEFEATFAFVGGPGEGAFSCPESSLPRGSPAGPQLSLMNGRLCGKNFCARRGDQFLTSAVLALDQHGGIGLRHAPYELTQLLGGRRAAKNFVLRILGLLLGEELVDIEHLGELLGFAQDDLHLFIGERLEQIIEGAFAHAFYGGIHRAFGTHHHDHRLGRTEIHLHEKFRPPTIGQRFVQQHQIEITFAEIIVRLLDAAAFGNVDPLAQELGDLFAEEFPWATMMTFSTGMLRLILVQLGDEVGVLAFGRRQMIGRHELIAEHELLVFAIERYDLHNEIGAMQQALADLGHRLFLCLG